MNFGSTFSPIDLRPIIFGLRELPGSIERGFLETVPDVRDLEIVERGNMEVDHSGE